MKKIYLIALSFFVTTLPSFFIQCHMSARTSGIASATLAAHSAGLGLVVWRLKQYHRNLIRQLAHAKVDLEHATSNAEKAAAKTKAEKLAQKITLVKNLMYWYLGIPAGLAGAFSLATGAHAINQYISH